MKILDFDESNVVYAEDQPEYLPLPALRREDGEVISCWGLSFLERLRVALTGRIWISVLTLNDPLQPLKLTARKPLDTGLYDE